MCANNFAQGIIEHPAAPLEDSVKAPAYACGSSLHACCAYLKLGLFFNGRCGKERCTKSLRQRCVFAASVSATLSTSTLVSAAATAKRCGSSATNGDGFGAWLKAQRKRKQRLDVEAFSKKYIYIYIKIYLICSFIYYSVSLNPVSLYMFICLYFCLVAFGQVFIIFLRISTRHWPIPGHRVDLMVLLKFLLDFLGIASVETAPIF